MRIGQRHVSREFYVESQPWGNEELISSASQIYKLCLFFDGRMKQEQALAIGQ